jgi:hypothetical protein
MTTTERLAPATRAEVQRELGHLDEELLERILALGPTVDDLRAACERVRRPPVDRSRSGSDAERLVEAVRDAVAQGED